MNMTNRTCCLFSATFENFEEAGIVPLMFEGRKYPISCAVYSKNLKETSHLRQVV